jgi:hypothetical protein
MSNAVSLPWPAGLRPLKEFHQSQFGVRLTGAVECVTTSVVTARNMLNELLAFQTGKPPLPDLSVQEYIAELDALGWRGILYRVPTDFPDLSIPFIFKGKVNPRGFMLPRLQARFALRRIASGLREHFGLSFRLRQTWGNSLEKLAAQVAAGNLVLVSGMYAPAGKEQGLLGGAPHTYGPVTGVDFDARTVTALDTGALAFTISTFENFLAFWGKKSLLNLYCRPFTMTALIPERKN